MFNVKLRRLARAVINAEKHITKQGSRASVVLREKQKKALNVLLKDKDKLRKVVVDFFLDPPPNKTKEEVKALAENLVKIVVKHVDQNTAMRLAK